MKRLTGLALPMVAVLLVTGCSRAYFGTMEKLGVHKREIMTDRVKKARDTQQKAKQEFTSAMEQFRGVVKVKGGDLEAHYEKLQASLRRSEAIASDVHDRIASVESVADALFREWRGELKQYSSDELRRASERRMNDARVRYDSLLAAMKKAEARIEPVLRPMRDQVLFLKHNLNAQAIGALTAEVASVESKVDDLLRDMETAIREADAFVKTLNAAN
jgi:uncharacterized protein YukE